MTILCGDLPLGVQKRLHQVSIDDSAGCILQAQTSAELEAKKGGARPHDTRDAPTTRQAQGRYLYH